MNTENKQIRIAIVDDHKMFCQNLSEILKRDFNFVIDWTANSGAEAIEKISVGHRLPDVLLLDLSMKIMDGFEVLLFMKGRHPDLKILAVTMSNSLSIIKKVFQVGFNGIVLKDEETMILADAIKSVHEKGLYISEIASQALIDSNSFKESNVSQNLKITPRELEFLKLCSDQKEYTYKEIANIMNVSVRTTDGYRDSLFIKIGVKRRVGLVAYYLQNISKFD